MQAQAWICQTGLSSCRGLNVCTWKGRAPRAGHSTRATVRKDVLTKHNSPSAWPQFCSTGTPTHISSRPADTIVGLGGKVAAEPAEGVLCLSHSAALPASQ